MVMRKSKRYGPVGSSYNSKKYLAMHNRNISQGLQRYWFARKAREAYANGTATPEQKEFVRMETQIHIGVSIVLIAILITIGILTK